MLGTKELALLRPYIELGEKLGRFQAQLVDSAVREVRIEFAGELVDVDARQSLAHFWRACCATSARVNAVNAFLIRRRTRHQCNHQLFSRRVDFVTAIRTRVLGGGVEQSVAGTIFGFGEQAREGRITEIDGFHIEAIPHGHMLVMRNRDVPGVIGRVGTILGERGVNISRFHLGRRERGGEAMAVIEVDAPVDNEALGDLRSLDGVLSAQEIEL